MTDKSASDTFTIQNARLLDPASGLDALGSLVVQAGEIVDVQTGGLTPRAGDILNAEGLCVSPGLIDLRVKTGEPGEEFRETLATAGEAAVAGGVTTMAIMPDTSPVIDDVALVEFIARRGIASSLAFVYPFGALTMGLEGGSMAEIGLMQGAGASMFSNGEQSIDNASVMKRIMTYAASLNACVYMRAEEAALIGSGVMNAGAFADRLGLSGMGVEAEWIIAARDILLAERTGVRYVLDQASSGRTLDMIAEARGRGVSVDCTVSAYNLFFNELDVGDYLTYCKTSPPFRAEQDRMALIQGIRDKTITAVVSAHNPQPPELKRVPFTDAAFGAAGLETTLAAMISLVSDEHLTLLEALYPLTAGPAELLGVPQGRLKVGAPADLVLFDPNKPWLCQRENMKSRSTNSPFDGRRLYGKVLHTFVDGQEVFAASAK